MRARWLVAIRPYMIVLIVLGGYLGAIFLQYERDPQAFVTLGSCFLACKGNSGDYCPLPPDPTPQDHLKIEGYDGQFNYYIARDPAHAAPCIDVPAYRYQRILLPLLGWLLSLGYSTSLPLIFLLINMVALVSSTYLVELLLEKEGHSRWFALSYGLFVGLALGVRLSTSEPLAHALVIGAIWLYHQGRFWGCAGLFALAALTKETTLLMAAGMGLWWLYQREWRRLAAFSAVVLIPFMVWQVYLWVWLGNLGIGSGGAKATTFEAIPFMGIIKLWTEGTPQLFYVQGLVFAGFFFLLPACWGWLTTTYEGLQSNRVTLYTCLLWVTAGILPFVPFSTYREYTGTLRFMPPLVLMTLLYSAERHYARPLRYSTFWIALLVLAVVVE